MLVSGGAPTPSLLQLTGVLGQQGNVTFLERPIRGATLVNAVQVALRARRRQYELRGQLLARARAEAAERQARVVAEEAVRVRDEFLASVAHDLKNPLGAIKGYGQLLHRQASKLASPEAVRLAQGLAKIDTMVAKALGQIDELLDLARLQAHHALPLTLEPTDLVGVWDQRRQERVLGNLLANAIKYSPEGGEITVEVRREGEAVAVLVVRDQGIGIPAAEVAHIFERFYRASNAAGRAGSGLGLAGVRQIVGQQGGTITVASEEGRGSCFTVRLPIVQGDSRPTVLGDGLDPGKVRDGADQRTHSSTRSRQPVDRSRRRRTAS